MKFSYFLSLTFIALFFGCQTEETSNNKVVKSNIFLEGIISTKEYDENSISFTDDGSTAFFTRGKDWDKQLAFISKKKGDKFQIPQQLTLLDTIYNGAISPSGKQIIYCKRLEKITEIWLTKKRNDEWQTPINLTQKSSIEGGYFNWVTEEEIYFYTPENEGDIVVGKLENDRLFITEKLSNKINTKGTEFSPYLEQDKEYLIFTRYVEEDTSQQGFFISCNEGNYDSIVWSNPAKIHSLPYGWGAFTNHQNHLFYYTDGIDIFQVSPLEHEVRVQ